MADDSDGGAQVAAREEIDLKVASPLPRKTDRRSV
jgi:hypothetical protein